MHLIPDFATLHPGYRLITTGALNGKNLRDVIKLFASKKE
jgi:hypothetical protein